MGEYEVETEFHEPGGVEPGRQTYRLIVACTEDAEHVATKRAEREHPGAIVRVLSVRQADGEL